MAGMIVAEGMASPSTNAVASAPACANVRDSPSKSNASMRVDA